MPSVHGAEDGLRRLNGMLAEAVSVLDQAGMDGFGEVYLYVAGRHGRRRAGDLTLASGHLALTPADGDVTIPSVLATDEEANRRALTMAELCFIMVLWGLEAPEVCRHLGCAPSMLDHWLEECTRSEVPQLPTFVLNRVRRMVAVEQLRILVGVSDETVDEWIREPRTAFGGVSVLDLLGAGDDAGYRRVVLWVLNGLRSVPTVH